jgi:hypothetical protein
MKIPAAVEYSGLSRSRLYQLARQHHGLFRKNGAATVVDVIVLDKVIDGLPVAVPIASADQSAAI